MGFSRKRKGPLFLATIILVSAYILLFSLKLANFNDHFQSDDNKNNNNNNNNNGNSNESISSAAMAATPAVNNLNANTRYLSFLPFEGLTNQFIGVEKAALIALKLNRTLILPPIMSNTHDHKNTHQRWSRYMNLPRFMQLTGLQVLEWDDVRPMTDAQRQVGLDQARRFATIHGPSWPIHTETEEWGAIAENMTCQIIRGYGRPEVDISFSAQNFFFHFLIRPIFVFAPAPTKKQDKPGAPIVYDNKDSGEVFLMEDILDRYSDYDISPEERAQGKPNLLFLSHTFNVKFAARTGDDWNLIGKNMHFQPKLMEYATLQINQEIQDDKDIEVLPNNDPEEVETTEDERRNPVLEEGTTITDIQAPTTRIPHIAVHLRRDDIWQNCADHRMKMDNCMIPIERYAKAVERARKYASRAFGLHSHLPVVVTTDTKSEEDFQKIKELGWHRLDHSKYQTTEIWGTFGEALVDAAILAHADVLVGNGMSTMSRIAVLRQKGWYGRRSFFPTVVSPKEKRRAMVKRQ